MGKISCNIDKIHINFYVNKGLNACLWIGKYILHAYTEHILIRSFFPPPLFAPFLLLSVRLTHPLFWLHEYKYVCTRLCDNAAREKRCAQTKATAKPQQSRHHNSNNNRNGTVQRNESLKLQDGKNRRVHNDFWAKCISLVSALCSFLLHVWQRFVRRISYAESHKITLRNVASAWPFGCLIILKITFISLLY